MLTNAAPPTEIEEPSTAAPKVGAAPSKLPGDEPGRLVEPAPGAAAAKAAKVAEKVEPTPQDAEGIPGKLACPKPTDSPAPDGSKFFKSIGELTTSTKDLEELRDRVKDKSGQVIDLVRTLECRLDFRDPRALDPNARQRWAPITYTWKASGLCHKPLYFEDIQLERYGHSCGPLLQPIASGAHFFLTVPMLPYKMGLEPPDECLYTLGYYRPGSCAPYMLDPIPLSVRAGLAEAGVVTGLVFLIP